MSNECIDYLEELTDWNCKRYELHTCDTIVEIVADLFQLQSKPLVDCHEVVYGWDKPPEMEFPAINLWMRNTGIQLPRIQRDSEGKTWWMK